MTGPRTTARPHGSFARRIALAAFDTLGKVRVRVAGRHALQKLNLPLLNATLRARGYDSLAGLRARLAVLAGAHPGRLHVHPYALGDVSGTAEITFGAEDSQIASLSREALDVDHVGSGNVRSTRVEVRRLDDLLASGELLLAGQEMDLLKVDTEGYEYRGLAGAQRFLAECRPRFVQLECNRHQPFCGPSLWQVAALLPGYTPYPLLPDAAGWRRVDPKAPASNICCFSNFVFVRDVAPPEP